MSHNRAGTGGQWFSSFLARNRVEPTTEAHTQMGQHVLDDDEEWYKVDGEDLERQDEGGGEVKGEEKSGGKEWNPAEYRVELSGYKDGLFGRKNSDEENTGETGNTALGLDGAGTAGRDPVKSKPEALYFSMRPTLLEDCYLTSTVPSLFGLTLPPCCPEMQVAYENIVHRLRAIWLRETSYCHITNAAEYRTVVLITAYIIQSQLSRETPPGDFPPALAVKRTPWRREPVFLFEIYWAAYFVREADMMLHWPNMTEESRGAQRFANAVVPIPKELHVRVRNKENLKWVIELWEKWHAEKRKDMRDDNGV
jgi:hypothetical protein